MRRLFLLLAILGVTGWLSAGEVHRLPLRFLNGKMNSALSGASAACTTRAFSISRSGYMSAWWKAYVNGNTGDSARYDVYAQYSMYDASAKGDTGIWPSAPVGLSRDTVLTACYGSALDTLRSVAKFWGNEFYPNVAMSCRLLFVALSGNSDSAYIDSVFATMDVE
jgi:hypothetical protein